MKKHRKTGRVEQPPKNNKYKQNKFNFRGGGMSRSSIEPALRHFWKGVETTSKRQKNN
jgi:hypothetical protein